MALAAHSLGIGSCYIASFLAAFTQQPALLRELSLPAGYRPFFSLALGYRSAADAPASERKTNAVNFVR